ncbi:MAG: hypothetical protein VX709_11295 [Pseudomonadota bacterium]|jgi:hypothetical protein|nr:hypothetical protein [Pseudomonadota bacterium]
MGFSMFLVGITIVCAGICHYLAKRKGFKPSFWIIMGACLGPLAVILILIKPATRKI